MSNQSNISDFKSYSEFWPFYLQEHAKPLTRRLHFIGTSLVIITFLLGALVDARWFWGMPLFGYGFAWLSHLLVEKNRPATFRHPLWSLLGDFHMFALTLTGRLSGEIERLNRSP